MGYLGNNLATVVTGAFAAVLSGLYFILPESLNFLLMVAIVITWFLTFMCWIVQKGQDYSQKYTGNVKKNYSNSQPAVIKYTAEGKVVNSTNLREERGKLSNELEKLTKTLKLKDSEISTLKKEIENLETMVQIETMKSELANLKVLAAGEKSKRKRKKK